MGRQPLTPPPRNDLFRVCRRTYERRVLTSGPGRLRVYYNSSEQGRMWRFFENSRTVNCQTRFSFVPARGSPLGSHMAAARQVFMFAFSS